MQSKVDITLPSPWRMAAVAAAQMLDVRETSRNQSPAIKSFWTAVPGCETFHDLREPWCAAFVSWGIRYAWTNEPKCRALKFPPAYPAVSQWLQWCEYHAVRVEPRTAQQGDVVIYLPHLSHIGFFWNHNREQDFLCAIEGNSNGGGSREGDGVYRIRRKLSFVGSIWRLPFLACVALCFGGCVTAPNSRLVVSPVVSFSPVAPIQPQEAGAK